MGWPDWYFPISPLSKLYLYDGLLFGLRNTFRQRANARTWEHITLGLLGPNALNKVKLEEEWQWSTAHTMLGFDINSASLSITWPEVEISGARVLFDRLSEHQGSRSLEAVTLQQVRCHIEHFRSPNAMWTSITGPIGRFLRYTDERAIWVNCPVPEVWVSFWGGLPIVFHMMQSGQQRRQMFQGRLVRLLTPDQRLSAQLAAYPPPNLT